MGVQAAVRAGFATIGNVQFVTGEERPARVEALLAAGAARVVSSWAEVPSALGSLAATAV